jgi:biopolymer transport protein ExbB
MKVRFITTVAIWAATLAVAATLQAQTPAAGKPAAKDAKEFALDDTLPGGTKSDLAGGTKEDIETLLKGENGEKTGDGKLFTIKTDDNIKTLKIDDIYKNEETAFKVTAIAKQTEKGGIFTVTRLAGQSDPQRRWTKVAGEGPQQIITRTTLLDLYLQGGPFLHPIALLFVIMTVLCINGCLVYRRKSQCDPAFVEASEKALRQGDLKTFEELARTNRGLLPFICRNMIQDHETSTIADIRSRVEVATMVQINRLRIPIRAMNLIAVAAPLLGLLGTIVGMVLVFEGVAGTSGAAKASILAAGIRVKLFSTATALMVAIPALFIYFIFNQKLGVIIHECELIHERFLTLLAQRRRAAGGAAEPQEEAPRRRGAAE